MRFDKRLTIVMLVIAAFFIASAANASMYRNEDPSRLLHKIYIPMAIGEQAKIIFPDGTEREVGRVLAYPTSSRHPGFTASKYGIGGQIIASAANTHHIQIDVEEGAGRTMSIVPMRTYVAASGENSSFVVEGEGGLGIWGEYAPFVGSPVYIINQAGQPVLFNTPQVYKFAKAIEIRVYDPDDTIEYFQVENKLRGRAWYHDADGDHDFGIVEQTVSSTGRFEGTVYEGVGMVRANHPGVVCISTSERGRVGGFQIVPRSHTFSHELQRTRKMSQYIVLRGPEFEDLTGQAPFYRGHVRPGDETMQNKMSGRVICMINGEWQDVPEVNGLTEHALEHIEAFRIYVREPMLGPKRADDASTR